MKLFYTPDHARVGDVIPFFDDGQWKPFYLKNWNPYWGQDKRYGWHMLHTQDHLHFTEEPTGILGGTGSVIKVEGVYHLFYCTFEQNPQRQYVCHATSTDGQTWNTLPEDTFTPDESIYLPTDWRDPHVLWMEEEKCWWMVLCAQHVGPTARRGCVGLCKSTDLRHWQCCEPLYAPNASMSAYECPDLFFWNGWWYLVFSQFTDRFATMYRMSRDPHGPWIRPDVDDFDGRAFYAAKTGTDGKHRLLYGWVPSKTQNHYGFEPNDYPGYDYNTWDWGGSLVVHELEQQQDGTLTVRPLPVLRDALPISNELRWKELNGTWQKSDDALHCAAPFGYAEMLSDNEVPQTCLMAFDFTFAPGTERIGIAAQVDDSFAKGYYFYFEPERQRVQFKGPLRMHEQGGWTFQFDVELERPLALTPGKTHHVELYKDESVYVLYVDHQVALSARGYDLFARKFGLILSQGEATFTNVRLWSC